MVGQVVLLAALILLAVRIASWAWPKSAMAVTAKSIYQGLLSNWSVLGIQLNYYHVVDIFLAGIIGLGTVFLVQRTRVVPVRMSAGSTDAHLRTILQIPNIRGKNRNAFPATYVLLFVTKESIS